MRTSTRRACSVPALSLGWRWRLRGGRRRGAARASRNPTSSCSSAAPRRSQEELADGARILPADRRHLSAEHVSRRRQTRRRRHVSRRRHRRNRRSSRSTSSASSSPSIPTHERADYAQYKLGMAHYSQMRGAASAIRPKRARRSREFDDLRRALSQQHAAAERAAELARDARSPEPSEYSVGYVLLPARWYPGAIDRFKALLKDRSGVHRRDAVYFYLAEC